MQKKLTCIVCPRGCGMIAEVEGKKLVSLSGNSCLRGEGYASSELFHATRMLTTTVAVDGRSQLLCVKTKSPIPKEQLMDCMAVLRQAVVSPPIAIGQVVLPDILDTGVDIVATSACQ